MAEKSRLVGYVRKSKAVKDEEGDFLRMSIDVEAFKKAAIYESKDGRQFVTLLARANRVQDILAGEREITSLIQIVLDAEASDKET